MSQNNLYAQVVVDIPYLGVLDYKVPDDMQVLVGDRVIVSVNKRSQVGIVVSISDVPQFKGGRILSIRRVLSDTTPLSQEWLQLTKFAANYYLRGWGEAAIPAIPKFLKREPKSTHQKWLHKVRSTSDSPLKGCSMARPLLNEEQTQAVERISASDAFKTWLLYGVTGSGKTEVYLNLIERTLNKDPNNQVLLLVPEINLTPQLLNRVRSRFPETQVEMMNSECSDGERAKAWLNTHEGRTRVLVGTRLAIFASFRKLSLILVDEEHDQSYKAGDGLRYSAKNLAVFRAKINHCPVVLGSATPSLETWQKAMEGKFEMLRLTHRAVQNAVLPQLTFCKPLRHLKKAELVEKKSSLLTPTALQAIDDQLQKGRQALIFLNRRGYAPALSCSQCQWVSGCPHCSGLTVFHKRSQQVVCHHCGWQQSAPRACPVCGNVDIELKGVGTERIEEELLQLFPTKRIVRIDRDSATKKHAISEALERIHQGEVDIIVGTQMIAKGHDFSNIGLVVIANPDAQLLNGQIRAKENLFSVLMQVSGRAGRQGDQSFVLVQTDFEEDIVFEALKRQSFSMFAEQLLLERKSIQAPPFVHQVLVTAEAESLSLSLNFIRDLVEKARTLNFPNLIVYDAVPMPLMRLKDKERAQVLLESSDRTQLHKVMLALLAQMPRKSSVLWTIDVDPIDV